MPMPGARTHTLQLIAIALGVIGTTSAQSAPGDLSGIWQAQRNRSQVLPENPQFTSQGRETQNNFDASNDPYLRCVVYMPRGMIAWQR